MSKSFGAKVQIHNFQLLFEIKMSLYISAKIQNEHKFWRESLNMYSLFWTSKKSFGAKIQGFIIYRQT